MKDSPNIVFIFPDQHRGDAMGFTGNPVVITPNLDRLASQGVAFSRCCSNAPLCMPARASFMTGHYVRRHGVWNNHLEADPDGPSHVRNIRDAGYHTAVIGKTHLYLHDAEPGHHTRDYQSVLERWGFVDSHELHGPLASYLNNSPYTDYLAGKDLLEVHRKYIEDYLQDWWIGQSRPWELPPCPLPAEDHMDSYTGRQAVKWIKNYHDPKPFYLQVMFPGPHDPFDSPDEYRARYRPADMPTGPMDPPAEPMPEYVRRALHRSNMSGMTTEQKQILQTHYYAKLTLIDEQIGRIIRALEEKGLLDNTWIVYSSDHGEMLGDHRLSHKVVFYDGALRIPCIVRPPRGASGWMSGALCDHTDLSATLLEIAGAETIPDSPGRSLVAQVQSGPEDRAAHQGKAAVISEVVGMVMVRDNRFRLTLQADNLAPTDMFDLENDRTESNNIVRDPAYEQDRHRLIHSYVEPIAGWLDQDRLKRFYEKSGPNNTSAHTRNQSLTPAKQNPDG